MSKVKLKVEIEEKDYKALIGQEVFNIWKGNTTLSTIFNAIKNAKPIEECDDCVSRQAILKLLRGCLTGGETEYQYVKLHIDSIPSVLPKREENTVSEEVYTEEYLQRKKLECELYLLKRKISELI